MPGPMISRSLWLLLWALVLPMAGCGGCADISSPPEDLGTDLAVADLGAPDQGRPDARVDLTPGPRRDWGAFPDINLGACVDAGPLPAAVDAATMLGAAPKVAWKVTTQRRYFSGVLGPKGAMYFTGYGGIQQVWPGGVLGWHMPLPPEATALTRATVLQGVVAFCSDAGATHGVYTTGDAAYSLSRLDGPFDYNATWAAARPTLGGPGRYYVGGADDKLYAFDHRGVIQWRLPLPGQPEFTVIDRGGTLYAPLHSSLAAVSSSGAVRWLRHVPGVERVGIVYPTANGDVVSLAYSKDKIQLVAHDRGCGRERWRSTLGNVIIVGLLVAGSNHAFYMATRELAPTQTSHVLAYGPTGKPWWDVTIEKSTYPDEMGIIHLGPIGADHTLYVFVANKGLYGDPSGKAHLRAYSLDGKLKWTFTIPDLAHVGEPLLLKNGQLVFAASFLRAKGKEYVIMAVQTPSPGLATTGWPRRGHDNLNSDNAATPLP